MATLGPGDLKQFGLPSNWDAGYLSKYQLAEGVTFDEIVADITAAMGILNREMMTLPIYGGLIYPTSDMMVEYGVGVSNGVQVHTEYSDPDAKRGATGGHMLPLTAYDRGLGWTWDYLRKARRIQLDQDLRSAFKDLRDNWEKQILTRLFRSTKEAVGTGYTMPLADGGTADSSYIPINFPDRATAFAYTHDHVEDYNGISQANLELAVAHIWEHGVDGPYELLVALADIGSWTDATALTGFVPVANDLIQYGTSQDLARVQGAVGVINTDYGACILRATARIPTTYWTVYKSYGPGDMRNPMALRMSADFGSNVIMMPAAATRQFPLEKATLFHEFGVGVSDRVGAIVVKNTSGSYSDPTIV